LKIILRNHEKKIKILNKDHLQEDSVINFEAYLEENLEREIVEVL